MFIIIIVPIVYSKLLGVIQFNRHGARTPKEFENLSRDLFFRSSSSHLTLNGYTQVNLLGKWLKNRYTNQYSLLNEKFQPDEYMFVSSPISRSIFSAIGIIESMFPGSVVIPKWENNEELRNNDIPPIKNFNINTTDITLTIKDQYDDNFFHSAKCKLSKNDDMKIVDMIKNKTVIEICENEIKNSLEDVRKKVPELFDYITEDSNEKILEKLCGFFLPVNYHYNGGNLYGLNDETLDVLKKGQIQRMYKKRMDESLYSKYIISPVFDKFKDLLIMFSNKTNKLKFVLFSGHDTNIVDILVNLFDKDYLKNKFKTDESNFTFVIPPFASSLILELHSTVGNLKHNEIIRVIYNGEILRNGFNKQLIYDYNLDGIKLDNFVSFMDKIIDKGYRNLYCNKSADEAEALLDSYLIK